MSSSLIIYPDETKDAIDYHLAWRVETPLIHEPTGAWTYLLDANTGAVLKVDDELRYLDASGTVTGSIIPEYPDKLL